MSDIPQDDLRLFAELCHDAVSRHGADLSRIQSDVAEAIARLPWERRRSLERTLSAFLKRQAESAGEASTSFH
ncbi:hypothetical protein [Afifella pfennigii]|uniref:hypothetical protein n=1 Tax=Afifella pfennigii TaxID=209897 RepID=UPI00047CD387|nr:hypothetical protein [Afifella pfennigii]